MYLREDEEHFAAAARLYKQLFAERTLQHERRSHIPVAAHLSNPGVFLTGKGICHLQEVIRALRPKFRYEPVSSLAHLGFAAEVVELQDQSCIVRSRFFCHIFPSSKICLE